MTYKVLIFRRGSLGDGVVSLPALSVLAERFPDSERRILTNSPVAGRAAPLHDLLAGSGLVCGYFIFPPSNWNPVEVRKLRSEIRAWRPDILVYLSEPSRRLRLIREMMFFRWCGVRRFIGLPFSSALRAYHKIGEDLWESEGNRLLRAINAESRIVPQADLGLGPKEIAQADKILSDWRGAVRFIVFCIGGKGEDKDWGDHNWEFVLKTLAPDHPDLGIAAIGSGEERGRSEALLQLWCGPSINLCGDLPSRISAIVAGRASFYLGHDSGPMHLAALAGVPCIAVFSARAKPGVWFPMGNDHRIFYPWELTSKIPATAGLRSGGGSIHSIEPETVLVACRELFSS